MRKIIFSLLFMAIGSCGGGGGNPPPATTTANTGLVGRPPTTLPAPTEEQLGRVRTGEFYRSVGLEVIGADYAYARGLSGRGVTIGLLDQPLITLKHLPLTAPEIGGRGTVWGFHYWYSWNRGSDNFAVHEDLVGQFTPDDSGNVVNRAPPGDQNPPQYYRITTHGTLTAGILAALKNDRNSHGIAYNAKILFAGVDDRAGTPREIYPRLGRNLAALVGNVPIVNFSFGIAQDIVGLARSVVESPELLGNIINIMRQEGTPLPMKTVFVLPTGNDRREGNPVVPASIAVAITELRPITIAVTGLDWRYAGRFTLPEGMLGQTNHYNPCGAAQSYCIAAPASVGPIRVADGDQGLRLWHLLSGTRDVHDNGQQVTQGITGTSIAAPLVAGSLALLKEAFPNLGNHELVARLLSTANNQAPYDNPSIYGHGALDLKAALEPVGTLRFHTGTSLKTSGSSHPLEQSWIRPAAALGDALATKITATAIAFDELDTPFAIPLARLTNSGNAGRSLYRERRIQQYGSSRRQGANGLVWLQGQGHSGFLWHQHGAGMWLAANVAPDALLHGDDLLGPGDGFSNTLAGFTQHALTIGSIDKQQNHEQGFAIYTAMGGTSDTTNTIGALAWLNWQHGTGSHTASLNWLKGRDTFLDGRSYGALAGTNSHSLGLDITARWELGKYTIKTHAYSGYSTASGTSILQNIGLWATEFAVGIERRSIWSADDGLAVSMLQPLRGRSGHINVRLPTGRTVPGELNYRNLRLDAEPSGREQEYAISYITPILGNHSRLQIRSSLSFEPGHRKSAKSEINVLLLYTHNF